MPRLVAAHPRTGRRSLVALTRVLALTISFPDRRTRTKLSKHLQAFDDAAKATGQTLATIAAASWLRICREQYRDTHNPVWVWEALTVMDAATPLPAWVASYLHTTALHLHRLSRTEVPPQRVAAAVQRALGFAPQRGRNPFRAVKQLAHEIAIAGAVARALEDGNTKLDVELTEVARRLGVSRSTVARVWRRHKTAFPVNKV